MSNTEKSDSLNSIREKNAKIDAKIKSELERSYEIMNDNKELMDSIDKRMHSLGNRSTEKHKDQFDKTLDSKKQLLLEDIKKLEEEKNELIKLIEEASKRKQVAQPPKKSPILYIYGLVGALIIIILSYLMLTEKQLIN